MRKIPAHKEAAFREINMLLQGDSAEQQCARLLQALRLFSVNTFEASRGLGIYHPPARILQLRQTGYSIDTIWQVIEAENGDKHRIGCYVLRKGESYE